MLSASENFWPVSGAKVQDLDEQVPPFDMTSTSNASESLHVFPAH